jgi:hypothetical protein
VNWCKLGLCMLVVSMALVSLPGCGGDNESDAKKVSAVTGDPGAPATPKVQNVPPTSVSDYNQSDPAKNLGNSGYPIKGGKTK